MTLIKLLLGPCASVGVHVNTPVAGLIAALVGALARLKLSGFVGRSESEAETVKVSNVPSTTVWVSMAANSGAAFTSLTIARNVCVALKLGVPLSVTITLIELVPGPCASLGVQVKTPLDALIVALDGAPAPRLNISVSSSGSLAELVNVSNCNSFTVSGEIAESAGGWFVAPTLVI